MESKEPTPADVPAGLQKMRESFPAHQISMLPKSTANKEEYKNLPKGQCKICGGYHPLTKTIHLSYVGHAALTDRLLDADPLWTWEPVAFRDGLPAFDSQGGLWIRLTVCNVTRLGYGNAAPKAYGDPGNREKEVIGDALRNAAMRFGAALELWHKGELHIDEEEETPPAKETKKPEPSPTANPPDAEALRRVYYPHLSTAASKGGESLAIFWKSMPKDARAACSAEKDRLKIWLETQSATPAEEHHQREPGEEG